MKSHDAHAGTVQHQPAASPAYQTESAPQGVASGGALAWPAGPASRPGAALQTYVDRSHRVMAQRRAIGAAFGAAPGQVAQRVIVQGEEGKGEYLDSDTGVEYAFVAQLPNGTQLLFATRDELADLRNAILSSADLPLADADAGAQNFLIRGELSTWKGNFERTGHATPEVDDALKAVSFVLVEEDKETPGNYATHKDDLLSSLLAVLGGTDDTWGHLTFKKPGFGERAPAAEGRVRRNRDLPGSKDQILSALDVEASDIAADGKYKNVSFFQMNNGDYRRAQTNAGTEAIPIPGQNAFYVSTATREGNTTSETEGNYLLNGNTFTRLDDIPGEDDEDDEEEVGSQIKASYAKLRVDRTVQDWEAVNRVGMRAGTQAAAMDNWNALGMAAYAKKFLGVNLKLDQDYEWLHIRGVQNGGRNLKANLGAGTWIANSAMIPYENQIRTWANKAEGTIEARYETTAKLANSPVLDKITIKIAASADHEIGPIARGDPLTAVFDAQSGLLQDSFSNKIRMKAYAQSAEDLNYRQGMVAGRANRLGDDGNARYQQGLADYRAGVQAASNGVAAPATQAGSTGHADYLAGIAAGRAGLAANDSAGHTRGRNEYLAGIGQARNGQAPGTGGRLAGHGDYNRGVDAAVGRRVQPAIVGEAAGHQDWTTGYTHGMARRVYAPVYEGERQGYLAAKRELEKAGSVHKAADPDSGRDGGPGAGLKKRRTETGGAALPLAGQ